jgi:hypothetical protein
MKAGILMSSVAIAALATPAFALPDRYEQGYSCTGADPICIQQQARAEDGNRADEHAGGLDGEADGGVGVAAAGPSGIGGDDEDNFGGEIGNATDEAGDAIGNAADEAGDAVGDAADDVGDAVGDAFD